MTPSLELGKIPIEAHLGELAEVGGDQLTAGVEKEGGRHALALEGLGRPAFWIEQYPLEPELPLGEKILNSVPVFTLIDEEKANSSSRVGGMFQQGEFLPARWAPGGP